MKKTMIFLCAAVLTLSVTACSSEPEHTLSHVSSERVELLEQFGCVAVYTQYTNGSAETGKICIGYLADSSLKRIMKSLQDKNYIRRESGKRYGKWEILV